MSRSAAALEAPLSSDFSAVSDDRPVTACFAIQARAEPSVLPRVLEPFAKRGLVPARWHATTYAPTPTGPADLSIDLQVADIDGHLAEVIAAQLRLVIGVETVLTSEKRYSTNTL